MTYFTPTPFSAWQGVIASITVSQGAPEPFGAKLTARGVNFALMSKKATSVTLCLFDPDSGVPLGKAKLDPLKNKTGDVWHVHLENLPKHVLYAYQVGGSYDSIDGKHFSEEDELLDPYAKALHTPTQWGATAAGYPRRAIATKPDPFDWGGVEPPRLSQHELIIYEMHVRGFTQDASSAVKHRGTFLGMIEKIPYLKDLGVNAVELLPIFEFDECTYHKTSPISEKQLYNYWGYATVNFFTPMNRFATHPLQAMQEFKMLVRELHRAGIEVILDVVYNHIGEHTELYQPISFLGIDASTYYILSPEGKFLNYTGCGNTFNCNHPVVQQLIIDSLRYWVTEAHVDGFRFDLASILTRDLDGTPLEKPPIIQAISLDPILSQTKLIAEAWDAVGLYQVGSFPGGSRWSEWNGKYRDHIRRFIKGTSGEAGLFANYLCGSQNLYGTGSPAHGINFITAHDGFSLNDLVSYNEKHNLDNGEKNGDGCNENESWNCGIEGDTQDKEILALRQKQMRNLHLALMISQGVPMLLMGDEYCHAKQGNNNTWCHDDALNWFLWEELASHRDFFRFYRGLIHFRKAHPELQRTEFLTGEEIEWHGLLPNKPDWSSESRLVAFSLLGQLGEPTLYIAFNANYLPAKVLLPPLDTGYAWHCIVDTALRPPLDFTPESEAQPMARPFQTMPPYSALLLKALSR